MADDFGFEEAEAVEPARKRLRPGEVITGVIEGISEIPQGLAEGVSGEGVGEGVESDLGRKREN